MKRFIAGISAVLFIFVGISLHAGPWDEFTQKKVSKKLDQAQKNVKEAKDIIEGKTAGKKKKSVPNLKNMAKEPIRGTSSGKDTDAGGDSA